MHLLDDVPDYFLGNSVYTNFDTSTYHYSLLQECQHWRILKRMAVQEKKTRRTKQCYVDIDSCLTWSIFKIDCCKVGDASTNSSNIPFYASGS